ncbi:hypothetical protein ACIBU0_01085 [Streptomyces sp. NPDC049627]|uniref:hypothetical protein n=1 Tax=Streptomyces sp. NPDC049627 TaxID=3365595 RepID=UPI00378CC864
MSPRPDISAPVGSADSYLARLHLHVSMIWIKDLTRTTRCPTRWSGANFGVRDGRGQGGEPR